MLNFFKISAKFSVGFLGSGGGGFLVDFVVNFSSNFEKGVFLDFLVECCRPKWVIKEVLPSILMKSFCL